MRSNEVSLFLRAWLGPAKANDRVSSVKHQSSCRVSIGHCLTNPLCDDVLKLTAWRSCVVWLLRSVKDKIETSIADDSPIAIHVTVRVCVAWVAVFSFRACGQGAQVPPNGSAQLRKKSNPPLDSTRPSGSSLEKMISLAVTLACSFWMGDVPRITLFASIFDCDFVERTLEFKHPLLNLSETVGPSRRVAVGQSNVRSRQAQSLTAAPKRH